jgi:chloramphenicol 3-O phosphotransferase
MNGNIIILNGTSSSGKTSVLEVLQEILEEPYLNAGIDKFIWMLPERYLERPLWDDVLGHATHAGATGYGLMKGMHHAIAALSRNGSHVLADHVLVEKEWRRECANLFYDLPAYLIGIHCPLDVLELRERERKNRTLGQAKAQFDLVHKGCAYDLTVDTSIYSPQECAEQIKRFIENEKPRGFKEMRNTG